MTDTDLIIATLLGIFVAWGGPALIVWGIVKLRGGVVSGQEYEA